MRRKAILKAGLLALALALGAAPVTHAQVTGLYYQEVEKDGRIYVFNTPEKAASWEKSGDMGTAVTLVGRGPNGETIVAENDTAMDLYMFKHNLPAYDRPTPVPAKPAEFPKDKIGIRVYADITNRSNEDEATGIKSADSGTGIDVKRTYFTYTHTFDKVWSAQFQSDIGDQGARRYDVFVKKAYIQAAVSPKATFRLGAADMPWVPFVEGLYGLRYIEPTVADRLSFATSSDWGFHITGKLANTVSYYASAVNGRTYSNPSRSKNVDFEGRLSVEPVKGLTFGVGGYSGKRGLETDAAPARHTATRGDALVSYVNDRFRIGAEYFQADNWNTVTAAAKDSSDGYSGWFLVNVNPKAAFFGRYDSSNPSKDLKPNLEDTYYNAGLQWRFNKALAGSLVYKHDEAEGGTLSTSNGTIGSTNASRKGKFSEFGVFAIYDF
jgi:hypothetical protein